MEHCNSIVVIVILISIRSFLFYYLLLNYTFQTNPNNVTNLSKLFNYIAPASLFGYIFRLKTKETL